MAAAAVGSAPLVHRLIAVLGREDIDRADNRGCTALWWAARWSQTLCMRHLLEAGTDASKALSAPYASELPQPQVEQV